jgi:hypothetical protein
MPHLGQHHTMRVIAAMALIASGLRVGAGHDA